MPSSLCIFLQDIFHNVEKTWRQSDPLCTGFTFPSKLDIVLHMGERIFQFRS